MDLALLITLGWNFYRTLILYVTQVSLVAINLKFRDSHCKQYYIEFDEACVKKWEEVSLFSI